MLEVILGAIDVIDLIKNNFIGGGEVEEAQESADYHDC